MSTEIKMITPEDCKISYSEFKEICFKNMKSALERWKSESLEYRIKSFFVQRGVFRNAKNRIIQRVEKV